MKTWHKALLAAALAPVVAIGGLIAFLAATYIDDTKSSGSAYGYTIGSSKPQTLEAILHQRDRHPSIAVYVSYGPRAGDSFTLGSSDMNLDKLAPHDQWDVLLRGPGEYFDSVRLTFRDGRLVGIYRHRQYFELP